MLQRLLALRGPILAIHIIVAAISAAVIGPISSAAIKLAIALSGKPALTDMEIARFFLTPIGLVSLVFAGSVLIVFAALEIAALLWLIATGGSEDRAVLGALRKVATQMPRLLWIAGQLILRLLLMLAPVALLLAGIAWLFLRQYDVNYYLTVRPPEFYRAVVFALPVLALALWGLVRQLSGWVLVLPVALFTQTPLNQVFRESRRLAAQRRWQIGRGLIAWAVASLMLAAAATGLFRILVELFLPEMNLSIRFFVALGAVLLLAWSGLLILTGAASAAILAGFLAHLGETAGLRPAQAAMPAIEERYRRLAWLTVASFVILSAAGTALSIVSATTMADKVEVIAHRGAAGAAPENTRASVLKAIEDGADWIEIDVQESADGEVIVVHDSDFMKLAKNPLKVWQASAAELAEIDIGSWFGPQWSGERVPTLRAVLEAARGRAKVLVELKYYGHDDQLAERVAALVEETGMMAQTAFMSLEPRQVARMKELRPQWRVGTLAARTVGNTARLQGDFLAISRSIAKAPLIADFRESDKDIYVWTVDDAVTMSRMISRGVSGLITNEPALARSVIAARAEMSLLDRLMLEVVELFGVEPVRKAYRDESP